jgi:hypothetical protein
MPRTPKKIEVMEDTSLDRLKAKAASKIGRLMPPWVLSPFVVGMTALFHHLWGKPATVAWAACGLVASTAVLAALTWKVSQLGRGPLPRWHSTITVFLTGGYVSAGTITGVTQPLMVYVTLVFGVALAITWNIRAVIRPDEGQSGDPLTNLFDKAKEHAGFSGSHARTTGVDEARVTGQAALAPGDGTVEDLQKRTRQIEQATGLPPGTLNVAANEDRADRADLVLSDPRVLRQVLPYPGPLHAGGSVADPLGLGRYQDMTAVEVVFLEYHLMLMGTTGSGKSFGGAWNLLAGLMSRTDAVVLAADLTKADQTLGDLAEALHWVAFTKAQATAMLEAIRRAIPARTTWLSAHGHKKWERGCGLKAVYVLLEEASDIVDVFDTDEVLLPLLRAARSAGIFFIFSLQRAAWTQFPTDLRALITGKMCFGVEDDRDAAFCLPKKVLEAGASPEDWQTDYPGMCYLAAPGISDAKKAMPIRTYLIHPKQMRQLAARFPAQARPLDEVTARAFGQPYANRTTPAEAIQLVRRRAGVNDPSDRPAATPAQVDPIRAAAAAAASAELPPMTSSGNGDRPLVTAAQVVITAGRAVPGMLADRLGVDPAHAARLLDLLEDHGVLGPPPETDPVAGDDDRGEHHADGEGGGVREVLVSPAELPSVLASLADVDADDTAAVDGLFTTADPTPGLVGDLDDDSQVAPPDPGEDLDWNHASDAPPTRKVASPVARQLLIRQLQAWQSEGRAEIATGDLLDVRQATGGYSRQWCQKMLGELVKTNVLRRDAVRNVYAFTGAPVTPAALSGAPGDADEVAVVNA